MSGAAELAGAPATVELGCQTMRRSVGIAGIEGMYDEHYRSFGYPAHLYKPQVIKSLLDRVSWQKAIDTLIRATKANPGDLEAKHQLALMVEHLGQIDHAAAVRAEITQAHPRWFRNNISVGRLMELSKPAEVVRKFYANACATPASYSLALARSVAINGPQILDSMTVEELLVKIENAVQSPADDIVLHLATGFVCLAKSDANSARQHFAAACSLADMIGENSTECDEWSLAYARAYLLDLVPPGKTAVPTFATIDPTKLAFACALQQRSQGASIPVLSAFEAAINRTLPRPPLLNHGLYHGYRITHVAGSYYAIPQAVTEFFFFRGKAYRQPQSKYQRVSTGKEVMASHMSPLVRRILKRAYRDTRAIGSKVLRKIPGGISAARTVARAAIWLYMRRYEIPGVLVDTEYVALQHTVDRAATAYPRQSGRAPRLLDHPAD